MQYCSLQHQIFLLSPVPSTIGCVFALVPTLHSFWSYVSTDFQKHIGHLPIWGVHFSLSFFFPYHTVHWGSQGKNTEVVCHSHLQLSTFCQISSPWPIFLGWPHTAWLSFTELDKVVINETDWPVVCDSGFSLSALWCPLSVHTILLGFLLHWTWGLSSWPLQESAATALYLGSRVAPNPCCPDLGCREAPLQCASVLPLQPPRFCATIAAVATNNSTTYYSWPCLCYCERIVCMLIARSKRIIKTNILM